jgi:hypothetical protein
MPSLGSTSATAAAGNHTHNYAAASHTHAYAASNHTHTCSIATDSGTNQVTLAYGSKYKLTAGGSTYIFTMPSLGTTSATAAAGNHTHNYAATSHTHDYLPTLGNAASASLASKVEGSYTSNGGQQNPNYFGKNRVGFLMMNTKVNNNSHYKDWIIMDCYSGNDVGGGVAFGVNRQALGAYIMRSAAARSSWAESAELIGTHNYTTYCAAASHTHAYAASSHTHNYAAASHTHAYAASSHTHAYNSVTVNGTARNLQIRTGTVTAKHREAVSFTWTAFSSSCFGVIVYPSHASYNAATNLSVTDITKSSAKVYNNSTTSANVACSYIAFGY